MFISLLRSWLNDSSYRTFSGLLLTTAFITAFTSGCDNEFNPLKNNDFYFHAINGYLNVHADTQWVRVMPVGTEVDASADRTKPSVVTLTRQSDGKTVVLKDTLFRFKNDVFVRNYYTAEPILPGQSYHLSAENEQQEISSASVITPARLDSSEIKWRTGNELERGTIEGVVTNQIAYAYMLYKVVIVTPMGEVPPMDLPIDVSDGIFLNDDGEFRIGVNHSEDIRDELGLGFTTSYRILSRKFILATATNDWPFNGDISPEEEVFPDVASNIENGTGFLAGISKIEHLIIPAN